MSNSDNKKENKRKTLSLKSTVEVGASRSSSGSKTIEIEIKKKKGGLNLDVDERPSISRDNLVGKSPSVQTGTLTDEEFKARVKALQEAMKGEDVLRHSEQREVSSFEENVKIEEDPVIEEKPDKEPPLDQAAPPQKEETVQDVSDVPPGNTVSSPDREKSANREESVAGKDEAKEKKKSVIKPVVFRASDYQKPASRSSQKPVQKPAQKKSQEVTKVKLAPSIISDIPSIIPDIPLPERNTSQSSHNKRERAVMDDSESPRRMKLVVRTRNSDRRAPSGSRMSRAMIDRVMDSDMEERSRSMASLKRARQKLKNSASAKSQEIQRIVRDVDIPDVITVGELANRMAVRSAEVVKFLMSIGTMATINQSIDGETAEIVCAEMGHRPHRISDADVESELENIVDKPEDLSPRAPIVAVMGHVDHGKTTLLDTLRKSSVAQKEAGGITQHVAAYQVETKEGKKITFIDTPGHAAFSKIRARGAIITDIIVLVVAADDGIKEQTIEVINQARAQNVPLVVAINKIDKPNINIDKVKAELMSQEVVLEDFGGETLSAEISAKQNINLDGLLEAILLQAEILELKANDHRAPVGTILESRIDKGKGVVSSVIIQHGTIKKGDVFVAGGVFGKVRMIFDDKGTRIPSAGPSTPVELVGFDSAPEPGDVLAVVDSEQKAREIAEYRKSSFKARLNNGNNVVSKTMDQLFAGESNNIQTLDIIIKADVYGSLEAVIASLEAIQHPEIKLNIIESGVGIISESDVDFARTTGAIMIGFNVGTSSAAKDAAKFYGIKILSHNVIYHMTEDVKRIMGNMLSPIVEEKYVGLANVRKIFTISRLGTIAGCYVSDGVIKRSNSKIKVIRDGKHIFEGTIKSMRHEKDEIKESRQGHECGILADDYNDFAEGDQIECYEIVLKARSVD